MKIALAQYPCVRGDIPKNINSHIEWIKKASEHDAEIILFPELSLSGYEPTLAHKLAMPIYHPDLEVFQDLSEELGIVIALGLPGKTVEGIHISQALFHPYAERMLYSKRILHGDEKPYFTEGSSRAELRVGNLDIALGICYESMQEEHWSAIDSSKSHLYLASVSKTDRGMALAHRFFSRKSREKSLPIFLSNAIGPNDNFEACGRSAAWNAHGKLVVALDNQPALLLINEDASDPKVIGMNG